MIAPHRQAARRSGRPSRSSAASPYPASDNPGVIFVRRAPVSSMLGSLGLAAGRDVLDRTGLKGRYDIDARFTPEPGALPPFDMPGAPDADSASIFTAVREQLGLTLAPATAELDVLSIERVERPTTD